MLTMSVVDPPALSSSTGAGAPGAAERAVSTLQDRKQRAEQVARATNEFAVEALLHVHRSASASCRQNPNGTQDPDEVRRQDVIRQLAPKAQWTQADVDKHLSVLIGRCDITARSSPCTDKRVTKHNHLLSDAKKCRVVPEGSITVDELGFAELFDSILEDQALPLEYGMRCGWWVEVERVRKSFLDATHIRNAVLDLVSKHSLLSRSGLAGLQDYPDTVAEAVHVLRKSVAKDSKTTLQESIRSKFWPLVVKCSVLMSTAKGQLEEFEKKVQQHVKARSDRQEQYFSYSFLGPDLIMSIAEFAGYKYISRMLLIGPSFSRDDNIKKLMPHLSVRCVPKLFPHGTESITGIGHCSIVSKNTQVHLVVDLAITGAKRDGMNYSTYTHATEAAGWSDDPIDRRAERRERYIDEQERRMRKFDEEPTPDDRFRVRLSARKLFNRELKCSVKLVYADTHQEVNPGSPNAVLSIPHSMAVRSNSMATYTARDGVPYPAYTAINVMHLSTKHSNRLYKFKVVANGWYKVLDGDPQAESVMKTLEAYSAPFAVVSTKKVFKRKRASA
jgi:hypothetical protein